MSQSLLVVNADGPETRVALIENGILAEFNTERKRERGTVGNIYKGRVVRVLPGMQAAFVDIGTEKAAFLYVADVVGGGGAPSLFGEEETDDDPKKERPKGQPIQQLLKEGQDVMVQVAKDPMGTKGARVTTFVSLPGRHLVLMPTVDHIGISRRIQSDKERKRLRDLVAENRPKGAGFVIRTVAEGASEKDIRDDLDFLVKLWGQIRKSYDRARPATLIYSDLDLLLRTVRDVLTDEIERIVIDSRSEYERTLKFVSAFMPQFQSRVELYQGTEPIFDGFGIEVEIDRALEKKVWLKSGGYLIIDQGEALTAIDVNTGRFVGKKNLEETITKNNLEACREVADQLRLRSIGGIIVIDFVDMDKPSNREKVWKAFHEALKKDRARYNVSRISELGLVEMTRKRTRESLARVLTEPCAYCKGKGYHKSKTTMAYEILREVRRHGGTIKEDTICVCCHPEVAQILETTDREYVDELEKRLQKKVVFAPKPELHVEQFEVMGKKAHDKRVRKEKSGARKGNGEGDEKARPA